MTILPGHRLSPDRARLQADRGRRLWPSLALVGCALACTPTEPVEDEGRTAPGKLEVVDAPPNVTTNEEVGWWPRVVVDADGTPHVAYCDAHQGDLKYATRTPRGWTTESVVERGAVGKYPALLVQSDGTVGISFYDQDRERLRYAERRRGENAWKLENIAWGREVGMASEMRADAQGRPNLFYYVSGGKLVHALRRSSENWDKQVITSATGGFSVRIDPHLVDGRFWVSFVDWRFKDTALLLAKQRRDGRFDVQTLSDRHGAGWKSQILFAEPSPLLLMSYGFKHRLRVQALGDPWKPSRLLMDVGNFDAIQAPDGAPIVVYQRHQRRRLGMSTVGYARREGKVWRRYQIDPDGPAGSYLSAAMGPRGRWWAAYYSRKIGGLKVYSEAPSKPPDAPERR